MASIGGILGSIGGALLSTFAFDVVGVYDQNYTQVFSNARAIKATIKPESKAMEQPLETGATAVDHRIILPIEIELSLIIQAENYRSTYQQIKQLFLSAQLLVVQTRADVYTNQLITGMPHEESPDMYDALIIALKLKETIFANTQVNTVAKPADTNTSARGNQQTSAASARQTEKAGSSSYLGTIGRKLL